MTKILDSLKPYVDKVKEHTGIIPKERLPVLNSAIDYIVNKIKKDKAVKLIFICTHNSRRSQFSQIWAQTAAYYFDIPEVYCYSGGVEVTAFNERAVNAIKKAGFHVSKKEKGDNPYYFIHFSEEEDPITAFSKIYDDSINAQKEFAAVMTCADADENCPFIPGAEVRIPLRYEDPKAFDGTTQEEEKYAERSLQIASEMFYIFSRVKS